jgi:hypothetical protein
MLPLFFTALPSLAAPTGPTLKLDYGAKNPLTNPLDHFMYFVPLISPELISVTNNPGNSQCTRILSFNYRPNGKTFHATCEFEIAGTGWQRNNFDRSPDLERHGKELKAGKTLSHQITAMTIDGCGSGTLEIDGVISNQFRVATQILMRFNSRGHTSPVNIELADISLENGALQFKNPIVARVNTITFRQKATDPHMEVSLDSVKRKDAGNSLWSNFVGGFKGMAANMFLPPVKVTSEGNQSMMDFGQALAEKRSAFTFPFAVRLKTPFATNAPAATSHR